MKKEFSVDELFQRAASYCSLSEHCVSEIDQKLTSWKVEKSLKKKLIDKLLANDFINEKRYAKAFVNDKFRFNKWGKIKIALALHSKGLNEELIDEALLSVDEEEYLSILENLLKSKLATFKDLTDYEKKGKLFRFAQGKGFEPTAIEKVLQHLEENGAFR